MSNFKEAVKSKLRISTTVGLLSVEQLWDLPLVQLDKIAVDLEEQYKESGKKSFLVSKSKKDKDIKLAFDIVLEILEDKVEERDLALKASTIKEHNQKIMGKIQEAKDKELDGLSAEELEKLLK